MLIVKIIFLLTAFVSTLYWLVLFVKLTLYKEPTSYVKNDRPSIVISAKNACTTLGQYLPILLKQSHYQELIVINDFSTDETQELLDNFKVNNPTLKSLMPSCNNPGKKLALSEGINIASSKNLILTDADCFPASLNWSEIMSSKISDENGLVLGYGPLTKESGFINLFSRLETTLTAIQYFGFTLFGLPYMGVGRNIAFTKSLFELVGGYRSHTDIPSGDDDLFVQEALGRASISISLDPKSFVYSHSENNLKDYIKQKRRHISTSTRYSFLHKVLLSINPFSHILFYFCSFILIFQGFGTLAFFSCIIRWALLMLFGNTTFKNLDSQDLIIYLPILDFCLFFYFVFFGLDMMVSKKQDW